MKSPSTPPHGTVPTKLSKSYQSNSTTLCLLQTSFLVHTASYLSPTSTELVPGNPSTAPISLSPTTTPFNLQFRLSIMSSTHKLKGTPSLKSLKWTNKYCLKHKILGCRRCKLFYCSWVLQRNRSTRVLWGPGLLSPMERSRSSCFSETPRPKRFRLKEKQITIVINTKQIN